MPVPFSESESDPYSEDEAVPWCLELVASLPMDEIRNHAVQTSWLQVLDGLTTRSEDGKRRDALRAWREFGASLSYDEDELRRERCIKLGVERTGCDWSRCPLNGRDNEISAREILGCSTCKAVSPWCCSFVVCMDLSSKPGTILRLFVSTLVSPTSYSLASTYTDDTPCQGLA